QEINERFSTKTVDYTEYEWVKEHGWQKQLHIFEVPFYYIEYAIAQLGAIAMWRNFKRDPHKTIEQYKAALALGNSVSIPEVYKTAGIKFDMSPQYVAELATFVKSEYDKLKI
ncbi:MAG TPA: M3 family metallopeptidase, partial [Flavobacteriales bacterium]|nr:M3 family metallopeptidase [Flavobacteriales bacterium]